MIIKLFHQKSKQAKLVKTGQKTSNPIIAVKTHITKIANKQQSDNVSQQVLPASSDPVKLIPVYSTNCATEYNEQRAAHICANQRTGTGATIA
jgi:hypothetical protein